MPDVVVVLTEETVSPLAKHALRSFALTWLYLHSPASGQPPMRSLIQLGGGSSGAPAIPALPVPPVPPGPPPIPVVPAAPPLAPACPVLTPVPAAPPGPLRLLPQASGNSAIVVTS